MNNRPSCFWKEFIKDNNRKMNMSLYINQKKIVHNISDLEYFPKFKKPGSIKFLVNIFRPFFTFKKRLRIRQKIHFPSKLFIAILTSAYIYYYIKGNLLERYEELNSFIKNNEDNEYEKIIIKFSTNNTRNFINSRKSKKHNSNN